MTGTCPACGAYVNQDAWYHDMDDPQCKARYYDVYCSAECGAIQPARGDTGEETWAAWESNIEEWRAQCSQ